MSNVSNIDQLTTEFLKPNKEKTYNNSIFIPLLENLLGSFSLGIVPFILYYLILILITGSMPIITQLVVIVWILLSIIIFSCITAFVFLSDDLKIKIIYSAFQLGYNLATDKNIIVSNIADEPKQIVSGAKLDVTLIENCLTIIQLFYAGKKISQRECEKNNITRNQWEAATKLMTSINLLKIEDKKTVITEASFESAKAKLMRYFNSL